MDVEVVEALDDDRTVVRRLLQLYHYDFSEFDGSDVNPHGEYLHRYFDEYWTDSDRKAFLFRVEGALAAPQPVNHWEPALAGHGAPDAGHGSAVARLPANSRATSSAPQHLYRPNHEHFIRRLRQDLRSLPSSLSQPLIFRLQ
ncbi:MAG TPA: hypothetical protein VH594_10435 [Trebonia sp.]